MRVTVALRVASSVEFKFAGILSKFNCAPLRGGEFSARLHAGHGVSELRHVLRGCEFR